MKFSSVITVLAIILSSTLAIAAGKHVGGHGDSAAIGVAGTPEKVTRTIPVDMSDAMRFTPSRIEVRQGETVRFIVRNAGKLPHEMVLGMEKELKEHYEQMKKHPEMEHDDDNMVTVKPGETGEIVWQFTTAGTVHFACLLPGHYEAGMKGSVQVKATKSMAQPMSSSAEMSDGEVRKIHKDTGKVTIRHGELKNLDMPPMTMVFQVKDTGLIEKIKVGDRIRFRAEKSGSAFVITEIQQMK